MFHILVKNILGGTSESIHPRFSFCIQRSWGPERLGTFLEVTYFVAVLTSNLKAEGRVQLWKGWEENYQLLRMFFDALFTCSHLMLRWAQWKRYHFLFHHKYIRKPTVKDPAWICTVKGRAGHQPVSTPKAGVFSTPKALWARALPSVMGVHVWIIFCQQCHLKWSLLLSEDFWLKSHQMLSSWDVWLMRLYLLELLSYLRAWLDNWNNSGIIRRLKLSSWVIVPGLYCVIWMQGLSRKKFPELRVCLGQGVVCVCLGGVLCYRSAMAFLSEQRIAVVLLENG